MSERNVEIARHFLEAHAAGRVDALLATLHPEVELYIRGGPLQGREAAAQWAAPPFRALQFQLQAEHLVDHGDEVLADVRMQFRWRRTGDLADDRTGAALFQFEDGLVRRFKTYDDRSEPDEERRRGVAWNGALFKSQLP